MADFGYVKQAGITPGRPYAVRKQTNLIILHHASGRTAMTDEEAAKLVRTYHRVHIEKGNRGIDYNFCVAGNGSVFDGRGLEYEGGHVLNGGASARMNARSVGICALGDFEHNEMPEAQKEGLKRIVRDVAQHYGITEIIRHKQVKDTDCPGVNYPFDEIVAYALGGDVPQPQPTPEPQPQPEAGTPELTRNLNNGDRGDDVRMAQERLNHHRANAGKVDGVFGKNTKAATIRFQQARIAEGDEIGAADGVIGQKTWAILWQG